MDQVSTIGLVAQRLERLEHRDAPMRKTQEHGQHEQDTGGATENEAERLADLHWEGPSPAIASPTMPSHSRYATSAADPANAQRFTSHPTGASKPRSIP